MKNYFEIKTLSDCIGCNNKKKTIMRDDGDWTENIPIIGGVISALWSIFGKSPSSIEKDNFLDSLVAASQAMGFQGFSREDVLHLMPAGWGEPTGRQNAAIIFDGYLQNMKVLAIGTNLSSYLNFGGGYRPTHAITYTGKNQYDSTTSQAGMFGNLGIGSLLLVGGLAYMFLSSPSKKRRASR
ncbi:MAG: hypothetical protein RL621_1888 [Bacteroidota bacterium]|jgi:hypothetical protein